MMGVHQFILMKKSGELLLSISPAKSHIDPTLVASFISAISVFSKEMVGYDVDIIATKTHKLIIDDIGNNLMIVALIDDEESVIDVQNKIKVIKKYITSTFPSGNNITFNDLINKLPELKNKIKDILVSKSMVIKEVISDKIMEILRQITYYDEIDGIMIMDESCKELASINLDEDRKFIIKKQLENLYLLPSIYSPKKVIFLTDYGVVVALKDEKFLIAATTSNTSYMGLTLSAIENNLDKIKSSLLQQ